MADPNETTPPAEQPPTATPAAAVETTTAPDTLRAAVNEMAGHAQAMRAAAQTMVEQVAAATNAVKTLDAKLDTSVAALKAELAAVEAKADANTGEIHKVLLSPIRQRAVTLPEIVEGPQLPRSQAAVSFGAGAMTSLSPLEAEVSSVSVHAVANIVPALRRENRALNIAIAALIVIAQAIQLLRH